MSVSSLGAKINSEENSPPLPEFSNCYFENSDGIWLCHADLKTQTLNLKN